MCIQNKILTMPESGPCYAIALLNKRHQPPPSYDASHTSFAASCWLGGHRSGRSLHSTQSSIMQTTSISTFRIVAVVLSAAGKLYIFQIFSLIPIDLRRSIVIAANLADSWRRYFKNKAEAMKFAFRPRDNKSESRFVFAMAVWWTRQVVVTYRCAAACYAREYVKSVWIACVFSLWLNAE